MSLEPHWFSTIYGGIFVVAQGLAALAQSSSLQYCPHRNHFRSM
jgi:hypothetical protein